MRRTGDMVGNGREGADAAAREVRRVYERHPYPAADRSVARGRFSHLPSMQWVQAIGRPGAKPIQRVLVAGCGTGAEAFELRRALPEAEIVAVDFSERSIALARRWQRAARPRLRPVRFEVADLLDGRLAEVAGRDFDLVSCHGVLSYVPRPGEVLRNLRACASPDGALYLGVNGVGHPAERQRAWLRSFGFDVTRLSDEKRLRDLLRLWDGLHSAGGNGVATLPASYLAGDVCGTLFNNWSAARWIAEADAAGWQLAGTWVLPVLLRTSLDNDAYVPLFPSPLAELVTRIDEARPASFHRLLLRAGRVDEPRWGDEASVAACQLRWTCLYALSVRRRRGKRGATAVLRCPTFNLHLDWPLSVARAGALECLMRHDGWMPWPRAWGVGEQARRTLWLWAAFGVVTAHVG